MLTGTKILLQPNIGPSLSRSYAEADARLGFFLTYFETVAVLAFNPMVSMGRAMLVSTEMEQDYILNNGGPRIYPGQAVIEQLNRQFFDQMATEVLVNLNGDSGGWALGAVKDFEAPTNLNPVDRLVLVLEGCMPTPHHETPVADILAFRLEHEAQLRMFHDAVDDLYYGFGARPIDSLLPRFKDKLDAHVAAIVKAYEGRQIKSYMGMLRIGLKVAPGVVGEILGHLVNVPFLGGALGGLIGFAADKTKLPTEGNAIPKDFEYVLSGLAEGHAKAFPHEQRMQTDISGIHLSNSIVRTVYPEKVTQPARGAYEMTVTSCTFL